MLNPMDMSGRNVIVTGASSGIGKSCTMLLSDLGAKVILVARNEEKLKETKSCLRGEGHRIEAFDLSKLDEIENWIEGLAKITGPLDGLVHCAGIRKTTPIRFLKNRDFQNIMDINFNAAVNLIHGFQKKNVCNHPSSIVLIGSVAGVVGQPGLTIYSASKSALIGLMKSAALELISEQIRVNCVVPGYVKSEMFEEHRKSLSSKQVAQIESLHPLGLGNPIDVANAVVFLLADTARWITGITLMVDGGFTAQ